MIPERFRPDCDACCGLCCVANAFDSIQGFGYNKPARTPCLHLQTDFRCSIHEVLAEKGFPGCVSFDCFGAGQWVTQRLFHGAVWSNSSRIAPRMFRSFSRIMVIHELLVLLLIAKQHVTDPDTVARLDKKQRELEVLCEAETQESSGTEISTVKQETMDLIRELGTSTEIINLTKKS